jgi:predicted DNA-binding transcriptional regulator AlpA
MVKVLETETIQQRFIRAKELGKYMDCSTTTIWWLTKHKENFPKPKKLSPQVTVWDINKVNEYMETL